MDSKFPFFRLSDGNQLPAVGFGTSQGIFVGDEVNDVVLGEVAMAVANGYRMFDTSCVTRTEPGLGKALKIQIDKGVIARKDVYVITKLWSTKHATKDVVPALKQSLARLEIDYVDLFLVHFPMSMPASEQLLPAKENIKCNDDEVSLQDTWKGMEECVQLQLTKSIGISSFNIRQVKTVMENCEIKPAVIQLESHPFLTNAKLIKFCQQQNIHVMAFCPLAHCLQPPASQSSVISHPVIVEIGKKHNKLPGQIALRYQYQRGNSILCKSTKIERQQQNINIFDFELSSDDMASIDALDQNFRVINLKRLFSHSKEYPFNED